MNIRYAPAARDDLADLKERLSLEFGVHVAARAVAAVVADISSLKRHRHLARRLEDKIGRPCDYLYFLCGRRSIAILSESDGCLSVIRILDCRTDYARTVFDRA